MVNKDIPAGILRIFQGKKWRISTAVFISLCLHLTIFASSTPNYKKVKDVAVEFELVGSDAEQPLAPEAVGPRSITPTPSPEEVPADTPTPDEPEIPQEQGVLVADTGVPMDSATLAEATASESDDTEDTSVDSNSDTATESHTESEETGATDTTPDTATDTITDSIDSDTGGDSSSSSAKNDADTYEGDDSETTTDSTSAVATGDTDSDSGQAGNRFPESAGGDASAEGTCFHDVFAFGKPNPSWMAWLSMTAFAGTRYERGLANILRSFYLYNEMVAATEIDPMTELEGVLISADDYSSFDTYQVVATYNVGQDVLKKRLKRNMGTRNGFSLSPTAQGISGIHNDSYRWDMVGSGRVLVASDAKKGSLNPKWPKSVTCMMPQTPFDGDPSTHFNALVRNNLGPRKEGERWPVIVMATRDPGAAGMYYARDLADNFEWAMVKGYFSEPIQLQGEVKFRNPTRVMPKVQNQVAHLMRLAKSSFVLKMFGLGHLLDNLNYTIKGNTLHFTVSMTEKEADALLAIIQQYSVALNAHFSTPKNNPTPSP